MRWLLLSDVHANREALEAVLAHAADWPAASVVCAGDLVGYGPDPEACLDLLRRRDALCVLGNHDAMALGRLGFARCNYAGIAAARWTRGHLSAAARAWLADLPTRRVAKERLLVFHGDLHDPERYVSSAPQAAAVLDEAGALYPAARVLVCGHTHHPRCFARGDAWQQPVMDQPYVLAHDRGAYLVNPGAVGQSREPAPLARYARYDDDAGVLIFHELTYDHERVRQKLRQAGLVPRVASPPPRGLARPVERWRTRWARWRNA